MTDLHEPTRRHSAQPDEIALQLVQPDGRRVYDHRFTPWVADIDGPRLRDLYRDMTIVRRLDAAATALQRQGELGLWAPSAGQEAAQVGSARALHEDDVAFVGYREHGVAWCRGIEGADLTRMWRTTSLGAWDPRTTGVSQPEIMVGAHGLHATGYAYAAALDGAAIATIVYFGDGATSQGDLLESLVFATAWNAGVVFFCENNQWAISTPVGTQTRGVLAARAAGFGTEALRVDGNDVLAVLAATRWALDRARTGAGPTFVEAVTCRMGPHTTSDDPTRYRTDDDLDVWRLRDPLTRIRRLLEREGEIGPDHVAAIERDADAAAAHLRAATLAEPDPAPDTMFEHVYAAPHPLLERERAAARAHLASLADPEGDEDENGGAR